MLRVAPLIKLSYSEAKYKTALATSFASPARLTGIDAVVSAADYLIEF